MLFCHRTGPHYRGTLLIRNSNPPPDHRQALCIVLLQGPREALFLLNEVTLYEPGTPVSYERGTPDSCERGTPVSHERSISVSHVRGTSVRVSRHAKSGWRRDSLSALFIIITMHALDSHPTHVPPPTVIHFSLLRARKREEWTSLSLCRSLARALSMHSGARPARRGREACPQPPCTAPWALVQK